MPRPKSNPNSGKSELSKAVRELREKLGLSQQAFSNALGLALNTIARYETSREPRGEALLKLSHIAEANELWDLRVFFETYYLDDVLKDLAGSMVAIPATPSGLAPRGYLIKKPYGLQELRMALVLSALFEVSKRNDDDISDRARDLILKADKWAVDEMGLTTYIDEWPKKRE